MTENNVAKVKQKLSVILRGGPRILFQDFYE